MYFLCVLAIFKNEEISLDLWIRHYLWMGVEHFYLIDNGSTDNSVDILKPYIKEGLVSLYTLTEPYKQIDHYSNVYNKYVRNNTKWVIVVDIDEFWYVKDSTIRKELEKYDQYDVIVSTWRMFGSENQIIQPEDVRVSNTHRREQYFLTKYIVQTKNIRGEQFSPHGVSDNDNQITLSEIFRINHYPVQSWDYFQKVKMPRGDVLLPDKDKIRDKKFFDEHDEGTDFEDTDLKDMVCKYEKEKKHMLQKKQRKSMIYKILIFLILVILFYFIVMKMKMNKKYFRQIYKFFFIPRTSRKKK